MPVSPRPISGPKPLLAVLAGQTAGTPPVWLMRQAGRYLPEYREVRERAGSFLDLCFAPKMAAEVTLQPIRRFGLDAAILFSDILVVPYALGQPLEFREGEGPVLEPVSDADAIANLERELDAAEGRLAPICETVSRVASALDETTALIGFCGAPWTVATYMVAGRASPDQAPARLMAYGQPETFQRLIDLLVEASARYLLAQVEAGAEALQIFDSWSGVLPEAEFRRWCLAPVKHLIARVRTAQPDIPIIAFPRGAGPMYAGFADEVGAQGVGCDTTLPVRWIAENLQPQAAVQGNLDPLALVAGGDTLDRAVDDIVAALANGPFIFNLGHGIVPRTPPEHVARLVARLRSQ